MLTALLKDHGLMEKSVQSVLILSIGILKNNYVMNVHLEDTIMIKMNNANALKVDFGLDLAVLNASIPNTSI